MATCPSGLRELIANQRFMGSNPIVASKKAPLTAGFSFAPLGVSGRLSALLRSLFLALLALLASGIAFRLSRLARLVGLECFGA